MTSKIANFENVEEALLNLRRVYSDLLGHYVYEGFSGEELVKKINEVCEKEFKEVAKNHL